MSERGREDEILDRFVQAVRCSEQERKPTWASLGLRGGLLGLWLRALVLSVVLGLLCTAGDDGTTWSSGVAAGA